MTSPSESASPIHSSNPSNPALLKGSTDRILTFQSDPSLPALLSSTSSVSADLEGEFLGNPGVVPPSSVLDTSDSLTPPAMTKEPVAGFPLEAREQVAQGAVPVEYDHGIAQPPVPMSPSTASQRTVDEDDGDSDSDEGLVMAKSKKGQPKAAISSGPAGKSVVTSRRRDTNGSIGSTDTAKKLVMNGD